MAQFYVALLEWSDDHIGYVRTFGAWAEHMGEALDKMLACAARQQIANPDPREIDPYNFETLPQEVSTDDDGETYSADDLFSFEPAPSYTLPYGVIASCQEGAHEIDEIQIGHAVSSDPNGLTRLSAVVEANELLPLYMQLLELLPAIHVFWIQLQADWEQAGQEAFYTHEGLSSADDIRAFLEQHRIDTVLNGHVTLTTYTEQGATNISLTDHKLLRVVGYDQELVQQLSEHLSQQAIPLRDTLVTIEYGFYHWHYRHPASRSRAELITWLEGQGFTYWNPREEQ